MPNQPSERKAIEITSISGLNTLRGELVRPGNSLRRAENVDMLRPGTIRVAKGPQVYGPYEQDLVTEAPFDSPIVGMLDYTPLTTIGAPPTMIAVTQDGILHSLIELDGKLRLGSNTGDLTGGVDLTEAPYLARIVRTELRNGVFVEVPYAVITIGSLGRASKWDGTDLTPLGVLHPDDDNKLMVTFYNQSELKNDDQGSSRRGISSGVGWRYRWSFWQGKTSRSSSRAAFNETTGIATAEGTFPNNKKGYPDHALGLVTSGWLTAAILRIDGEGLMADIMPDDYGKIVIWRSLDAGVEYYILPRVYDKDCNLVSDENGAIEVQPDWTLGFQGEQFYDGCPLWGDILFEVLESIPTDKIISDEAYTRFVEDENTYIGFNATNSGGTVLDVEALQVLDEDDNPVPGTMYVGAGLFNLTDDETQYRIVNVVYISTGATVDGPTYRFEATIDPPLNKNFAAGDKLYVFEINPVRDDEIRDNDLTPEGHKDPPPAAYWGIIYSQSLWLVDADNRTRIIYSDPLDFEAFPPDNELKFIGEDDDDITSLVASRQQGLASGGRDKPLLISKARTTLRLQGESVGNFFLDTQHPSTGVLHKRAANTIQNIVWALTNRGLETIEREAQPLFAGEMIRDFIESTVIDPTIGPASALNSKDNTIVFALRRSTYEGLGNDVLLLIRGEVTGQGQSPFTLFDISEVAAGVCCLYESVVGTDFRFLMGGVDGKIYNMFMEYAPVVAYLETQELPQERKKDRRSFHKIWFDGNEISDLGINPAEGWYIQYNVDGYVTVACPLQNENFIGLIGKTLVVYLTFIGTPKQDVLLSNYFIEYSDIGTGR